MIDSIELRMKVGGRYNFVDVMQKALTHAKANLDNYKKVQINSGA